MKQLSLRTKLYILILTVVIPLLILQLISIFNRYDDAVTVEVQSNQELAETISSIFLNYVNFIWNTEKALGTSLVRSEEPYTPEIAENYLRPFAAIHPTIRELLWIDPEGNVLASTFPNNNLKNIAKYYYFKKILDGEDKIVSDLIKNSRHELGIAILTGIRDNSSQSLEGVVMAWIDINKLGLLFPHNNWKITGDFGLIDNNGMIIYENRNPHLSFEQRQIQKDSPARMALQGQKVLTHNYDSYVYSQDSVGANIPIPELNWVAFSTTAINEVLEAPRCKANRDIIILMLIGIVVTLAYGYLISDKFIKPLVKLQQTALAISKGDLTARANLKGNDELGTTGQIFDQMADRIQHLEVSRTRFLQTAAHELRNPMAGIKGILSLIQRRMATGKPLKDLKTMFETMEKEIDRLSDLLNQILEAFRTQRENGMLNLHLKKVNLFEIIDSALKPFQLSERCKLIYDPDIINHLWLMGDFTRLEEVFRNLLSNAIKYSPEDTDVIVTLTVEKDHALIAVKDYGIGIPREQLEGIFECFYRASNLEKNDPGGMGLGLYICKEIIDSHMGSIWAESEEGKGSTFFVKLPLLN